MSFTAADLQQIRQWMQQAGVTRLRLDGPGGSLDLGDAATADITAIKAPVAGHFLPCHPLRDAPLAPPGTRVEAGDIVALIRIGTLLLPVPAPAAGIIGEPRLATGLLAGYGTPLFDLHPLPVETAPC